MSKFITGLDSVLKHVKSLEKDCEIHAKKAVSNAAYIMEAQAKALAPVRTGYLRESIKTHIDDGGLSAKVISHSEYSLFVEFGTSKQESQPYMMPAYFKAKLHFEKLMKDWG
jgi:HK97 gp10 family phage protein